MNSFACVAFFAALACANAGILAPSARIIQGPSSRTTVVGPDGSTIHAVAPGGQIITEEHPAVVAHSAPVIAAPLLQTAYASAPILAHSAPILSAPVAYGAVGHQLDTLVAGPSGSIATSKLVASPLSLGVAQHALYL